MTSSDWPAAVPNLVRPYRPEDREAVRQIAFLTGLFGDSIEAFVPDRELFADLWTVVYTDVVPALALVASLEDRTVGYILGVANARSLPLAYLRCLLPLVVGRLWRGEYRQWRESLPYLWRSALEPSPHAPFEQFPAHLHINLLEAARGLGAGRALLDGFLAQLEAAGVPGVQLSTTDHNRAAVRLYEKLGFRIWASDESRFLTDLLAGPNTGPSVRRLVMVRSFN
jgi:ribosomal protein S18 acetylase RimI-like enzyme